MTAALCAECMMIRTGARLVPLGATGASVYLCPDCDDGRQFVEVPAAVQAKLDRVFPQGRPQLH